MLADYSQSMFSRGRQGVDSLPTLLFLLFTKVLQRFALAFIAFPSARVKIQYKSNVGSLSTSSGSWRKDVAQRAEEHNHLVTMHCQSFQGP